MTQRQSDEARFRQKSFWAQYDKCSTCRAISGNPCRIINELGSGQARLMWRPHPDREKKKNATE